VRLLWLGALTAAAAGGLVQCGEGRPARAGPSRGKEPPAVSPLGGSGKPHSDRGYVLFSPLLSTTTYLIDRQGRAVHTWESECPPGATQYLLGNGRLLRCGRHLGAQAFSGGGEGGRIQELAWDGAVVWEFVLASADRRQHHDIEPLPNGNVLLLAWEAKSREEAVRAGRKPFLVGDAGLWFECVLEVKPVRPRGGTIVWEWHMWDHLVQDHDATLANYGAVAEHPELIDINGGRGAGSVTEELIERLRALGYLARGAAAPDVEADFVHANSVAYNPRLDQVALSVNQYNEVWIIDHSTTGAEATGHAGGRAGRGGDLLYRWGNPRSYGRGAAADQLLSGQHDARWIPPGYPGAGHLTVFNNGGGRPGGDHSSVLELELPVGSDGRYAIGKNRRFGPDRPFWEYVAPRPASFFADFISGAERLPSGNTLICAGPQGRIFEVTPEGATVWEYSNPYRGDAPNPHGDPPYSVFWAAYIPVDHPAVAGRSLAPLDPPPPQRVSGRPGRLPARVYPTPIRGSPRHRRS